MSVITNMSAFDTSSMLSALEEVEVEEVAVGLRECAVCCDDVSAFDVCKGCGMLVCHDCIMHYLEGSSNNPLHEKCMTPSCEVRINPVTIQKLVKNNATPITKSVDSMLKRYEQRKTLEKVQNGFKPVLVEMKREQKDLVSTLDMVRKSLIEEKNQSAPRSTERKKLNDDLRVVRSSLKEARINLRGITATPTVLGCKNCYREPIVINPRLPHSDCSRCGYQVCSTCHDEYCEHKCDPDKVSMIVKKEIKYCPSCFIPVAKVDGCDHMFCVDCKTYFSWNSCKVINNTINPDANKESRKEYGFVLKDPVPITRGDFLCDDGSLITSEDIITILDGEEVNLLRVIRTMNSMVNGYFLGLRQYLYEDLKMYRIYKRCSKENSKIKISSALQHDMSSRSMAYSINTNIIAFNDNDVIKTELLAKFLNLPLHKDIYDNVDYRIGKLARSFVRNNIYDVSKFLM